MTEKELLELGLGDDQVKKVLALHKSSIDGKYEPKERNEQLREQLKAEKDKVAERDKQISDLSKSAEATESLRQKLHEMEEANKVKDAEATKKLAEMQMNTALKVALAGKVHDVDLAITLFDSSKIKLDANGAITGGFKEQFDALAKEKSYLFVHKNPGVDPPKPGVKIFGNGAGGGNDDGKKGEGSKGLDYAKDAAKRKNEALKSAQKAADAFFGGSK